MYSLKGLYPAILCDVCGFEKKFNQSFARLVASKFFRPHGCKKAAAVVYQHYGQSGHHLAQLTVRLLFGFGHRDLSQTLNMASTCVQMKLQMPFIVHVLRFGLP